MRNPVPTPKSTTLPPPSGGVSYSSASTEHSLRSLDSDSERDGAGTPRSSPCDFPADDDGCQSAHSRRGSQGSLNWGGKNREGNGEGSRKSHNEIDRDDELFPRSSTTASRRKRRNLSLEKNRHNPSRTTLGQPSSMLTRASQQGTSSQPQPLYRPVTLSSVIRSCTSVTSRMWL
jgi:hypothetical protein